MTNQIRPSADLNYWRWPTIFYHDYINDNSPYNDYSWYDSYQDYDEAIKKIKEVFLIKVSNMDSFIEGF